MFECRRAGGIGRHTGLKILWTFVRAGSSPALGTSGHDIAGWSSQVARRAHNPKVAGSNPAPATNFQGGVAQMARACGSYPQCHWFDSSRRHHSLIFPRLIEFTNPALGGVCCILLAKLPASLTRSPVALFLRFFAGLSGRAVSPRIVPSPALLSHRPPTRGSCPERSPG